MKLLTLAVLAAALTMQQQESVDAAARVDEAPADDDAVEIEELEDAGDEVPTDQEDLEEQRLSCRVVRKCRHIKKFGRKICRFNRIC